MRNEYERFQQVGAQVLAVVMAAPQQAAKFRSKYQLPYRLLCDPERKAYAAFGLERGGLMQIAGPAVWAKGFKSTLRHGVGKPIGDTFQLGGAFVIDRQGQIVFAHRSADSADNPSNDDLIAAIHAMA